MLRLGSVYSAVIANPHAGFVRRRPGLLRQLERAAGREAELCFTQDEGALLRTAQRLAREGFQHVAIVGGDGTASATLTALAQAYGEGLLPIISLLRGGTMNTVANALGIARRPPPVLLRRALDAVRAPGRATLHVRPTIRVASRLGFLVGTGVWHGYLSAYYAAGDGHPTPITAARVFGEAVGSALQNGPLYRSIFKPSPLRVEIDGGQHWEERTYMTVCAGTVDQAGLGFRVFHRAFSRDDRMHLIGIKGSPADVAKDLPSVWRGGGLRENTAYQALVRGATVVCDAGTFGYSVDGDLYEAHGRLHLGLGPQFRFLLPGRSPI